MVILMRPLFCYFAPDLKNIRTGPGCTLAVALGGGGGSRAGEEEEEMGERGKRKPPFIYTSMAVVVDDDLWFINGRHSQCRPLAIF